MADQVESAGGALAAKHAVRRIVDSLTERQRRAVTLVSEGKSIEQAGNNPAGRRDRDAAGLISENPAQSGKSLVAHR